MIETYDFLPSRTRTVGGRIWLMRNESIFIRNPLELEKQIEKWKILVEKAQTTAVGVAPPATTADEKTEQDDEYDKI